MNRFVNKLLLVHEMKCIWTVIKALVSIIIIMIYVYYINKRNIDVNLDSLEVIASLSLAFFAINGAYLTFFITLDKSPIFNKLRKNYDHLFKELNNRFKNNMIYAVLLNVCIFLILLFKDSSNITWDCIAIFVFTFLTIEVIAGFIYLLDISNNLISNKIEKEHTKK